MVAKIIWASLLVVVISTAYGKGSVANHYAVYGPAPALKAASVAKKDAIKLYPNPSTNGRITISSSITEPLHFYVFDLDGTLLHQVILKDKQKKTIENLKKGIYVYDAFLNDEGIEHGNIIVK